MALARKALATGWQGGRRGSHYNTLIVACGTDAAAAREVVDQMKADGFEPSGTEGLSHVDGTWE